MILVNTEDIAHKKVIKSLGLVKGNTIRARNIGRDIVATFKNVVGGEIEEYTKLLGESREQALDRMISQAEEMGANAVVNIRFSTSEIMNGAAEIMAYGTAVFVSNIFSVNKYHLSTFLYLSTFFIINFSLRIETKRTTIPIIKIITPDFKNKLICELLIRIDIAFQAAKLKIIIAPIDIKIQLSPRSILL